MQTELAEKLHKDPAPLRACACVCDVFLALLFTVYLLWFDGSGYTAITAAKRNAFYVLFGGFLLSCLVALAVSMRSAQNRQALHERLRGAPPMLWCMLGYLGFSLVAALLSQHPETWLGATRNEGFVTQLLYVLSFAALLLFARPRSWQIFVFGAGLSVLCAVAVLQLCRINPFGLYPQGYDYYNVKEPFLGTVGNIGFLGALLCVVVPVLAASLLRLRGRLRFLLLLPLAGCLFVLFSISINAAYTGLALGCLSALPGVLSLSKRATHRYFLALLCLLLVGIGGVYFCDTGRGTLHELHALLHGHADDSFGTGRLFIWRQVLARVGQRPWFGYGPDTMYLEKLTPFTRYDATLGRVVTAAIDTAHNEYLNILFHQGIFALASYLAGLGCAVAVFYRRARANLFVAVFGAAVLCYAVQALFGISQPITAPYFWMALGLLGASVRKADIPVVAVVAEQSI